MPTKPTRSDTARRPSVGILAVQFGLISQKDLMDCLDVQRETDRELQSILIERGLLTPAALEKIVRDYDESIRSQISPSNRDNLTERKTTPAPREDTPVQQAKKSGTRRPTTSLSRGQGSRAAAVTIVDAESARRRQLVIGMVLALTPLVLLGGYLLWTAFAPAKTPPGIPPIVEQPIRSVPPPPKTAEPEKKSVRLEILNGTGEIVARWNRVAERVNSSREPEQYKPFLDELSRLVTDAKGTPWESQVKEGYRAVRQAMNERGKEVFEFLAEEAKRLAEAGRFGDSMRSWDWFPGNLDPNGDYAREMELKKAETLEQGRAQYKVKRSLAAQLAEQKKFDQAKLTMLEALEMGLVEFTEDAYDLVHKYNELEDSAARAAELAQIEEFDRKSKAERETSQRIAVLRGQFWEWVSRRKLDAAKGFLAKQRTGSASDLTKELDHLQRVLDEITTAFQGVEGVIAKRKGQQATISFLDGVKNLQLKDASNGRIIYTIEGREFSASLYEIAASEFDRAADVETDPSKQRFLRGVGSLLKEDFPAAFEALAELRSMGASLRSFIENSEAFLAKNAPLYKERAARYMEEKAWDKAAQEYSRLVLLPAERKTALLGRARCYFNAGNFVGTVLDVEQLFDLGEYGAEALDLLNQSYQRATLIEKAIQIYERARKKSPENGAILGSLVMLYLRTHDFTRARETLASATRISGMTKELMQAMAELQTLEENPFAGQVFKASWDRYDVQTNASQRFATEMAQFMAKVYKQYEKVFPPDRFQKNKSMRFKVKLFAAEGEFFAYCRKSGMQPQGPYGKVLAFYNPTLKELVGWKQEPIEELHETMTHEGLHQFIDYFVDDCPIWFNEGYASYFEKSTADEPKFNRERHMTAMGLLHGKQLPHIRELMMMDRGTFQRAGALHYGSSWSLIFYLTKTGQKPLLDRYFEELMQGKTQEQAFDAVFGKIDLGSLDAKWRRAIFESDYEK